ncbi:MAG: hypothetical protein V8T10_02860 [Merdibacter sp.]
MRSAIIRLGRATPASLYRIDELIRDIDACEVRIGPDETMYIINLTADEVPAVLKGTDDGARTAFEHSVSCVGASICQVGLRDSNGALQQLVRALRPYEFADACCRASTSADARAAAGPIRARRSAFRAP